MISEILHSLEQTDQQILLYLNSFHNAFGDYFMSSFSGKFIWAAMYATLLYVVLKSMELKIALICVVAIVLTIVFADQVCASVIRPVIARLRPSNLESPISDLVHIVNDKRGGRYGFPSCHASNSFGLAFIVIYLFRHRWLSLFILLWATLNSYSRIYLGVHFPGDVLTGAIVGLIGATICYLLFRLYTKKKKIELKTPEYVIYIGLATIAYMLGKSFFMTL